MLRSNDYYGKLLLAHYWLIFLKCTFITYIYKVQQILVLKKKKIKTERSCGIYRIPKGGSTVALYTQTITNYSPSKKRKNINVIVVIQLYNV